MPTIQEEREFIKKHLTSKPPIECGLRVGDLVTFTNPQGVKFKGRKVIGFDKEVSKYGAFVHLSGDTPYWFPLNPSSLKKEA